MSKQEYESKIALTLAHRAYRYALLHLVFGAEPNTELVGKVFSKETREAFTETDSIANYLDEHASQAADPSFLENLNASYRAMFYAMDSSNVVAWESPYLDENGMLFQESTLDVREFYHQAGLKLQAEKQFPDDHIAAMMDFLARLSSSSYERFADGLDKEVAEIFKTQRAFMEKHLLHWLPKFSEQVVENDKHGLYAAFAQGMKEFVEDDYRLLGKAIEELG